MSSVIPHTPAGHGLVGQAVRAALAGASLALAAPAAAAGNPDELDEVRVSAQFREQDLQDTPIAITVVSGEQLTQRSQTNITEVAIQAPNVTLKPQSPQFGPSMAAFIRGVGAADFNPALEPGVGLYVDDVYYATLTGAVLDLLDLERVEIHRGPQGTLSGRNSLGGAVELYSRKPQAEDSGYFSVTYGSRDRLDLRGMANFSLTDKLFVRISGVDKSQQGYVDRIDYGCAFPNNPYGIRSLVASTAGCRVARDSNVNFSGGRVALRWIASERVEVNLATDYTNDRRNPTGAVLLGYRQASQSAATLARIQPIYDATPANDVPPTAFVVPYGSYYSYASFYSSAYTPPATGPAPAGTIAMGESRPVAQQYFESWGMSLRVDARINDLLSLDSISAYRSYQSGFSNDNDLSPLNSSMGDGNLPFDSFSQELRLNGDGQRFNWTLGSYYLDQRSRYQSWLDLRFTGPLQFQQNDVVNVESKAIFGNLGYHFTERLVLTAGLRHTDEHKDYTFVRLNREGTAPASIVGALNGWRSDYDGHHTDYRLAAQYRWTDGLMTYLQYATGFKGGGISPRPFFVNQALPFDPEELRTWELGTKADLLDRRLRINAAVFHSDLQDLQIGLQICPTEPSTPCGAVGNAGEATIQGVELEAQWRVLRGLTLDASYGYTDFQYERFSAAVVGMQMSHKAPFLPDSKGSLGAQYDFPLRSGGALSLRGDASFQSSMYAYSNNSPTNFIGRYALFNARLTWKSGAGDLEAALEGTNLADKYYLLSRGDQYILAGHTDGQPGRPREWALSVTKRF